MRTKDSITTQSSLITHICHVHSFFYIPSMDSEKWLKKVTVTFIREIIIREIWKGNSESSVHLARLTLSALGGKIKRNQVFKHLQDLAKGGGSAAPDGSSVSLTCAPCNLCPHTGGFWEHKMSFFPQKPLLFLLIKFPNYSSKNWQY